MTEIHPIITRTTLANVGISLFIQIFTASHVSHSSQTPQTKRIRLDLNAVVDGNNYRVRSKRSKQMAKKWYTSKSRYAGLEDESKDVEIKDDCGQTSYPIS